MAEEDSYRRASGQGETLSEADRPMRRRDPR